MSYWMVFQDLYCVETHEDLTGARDPLLRAAPAPLASGYFPLESSYLIKSQVPEIGRAHV